MKQVSQTLRDAMVEAEKHGVSLYRMAKACELDDSIVYRFYHDECGLALSSVDRLCAFLNLELVQRGTPVKPGPAKKQKVVKKKPTKKKIAKKPARKAVKKSKKKPSKR